MITSTSNLSPGQCLALRLERQAPICVGLDPIISRLPDSIDRSDEVAAIEQFSRGVLDSVVGITPCVKVQAACFERYGSRGVAAMERVITAAVDADLLVILDAKRGDIGISATHYAAGAAATGAHWITLNGYLGEDGVIPFLDAGLGVFVLVRTSNPSGDEIQSPECGAGTVAGLVGSMVGRLGESRRGTNGLSSVGAVVGATKPEAAAELRAVMPDAPFLLPGYGAQGGGVDGVRAALDRRGGGVLVTASRSIIHAFIDQSGDWRRCVKDAAATFAEEIGGLVADQDH
ncbi:MAG: orotidine-5'-phosphate decarboxylase [Planctomycetota bacterium]|jgi:orotidine-5'-phosphate decarboxylase|nr:orotidine-5'-phosphate decarboxylase [Planctomycetota bacterium]MDA1026828.1 orotidine-5'-phosphate decarboxylase [Planctomycetota bacterium]